MAYFSRLEINEWQQFRTVDIEFHERLTIITGANASGKTTLLNVLARHANWNLPSLATPVRSKVSNSVLGFFTWVLRRARDSQGNQIGTLTYNTRDRAKILVPEVSAAAYLLQIEEMSSVPCFFVPSHRSIYRYGLVGRISTGRLTKQQAFERVQESTRSGYIGGGEPASIFHMKDVLISWSIFGRGNVDMVADKELEIFYDGFQETLRKVLPPTLGFRRFAIRSMEIVLECESGEFILDGASGGLNTLIDLAWQIFMYGTGENDGGFTVIIDEVENHLHPTAQRRLLSDLLGAFPKARFVVSTHSPLIVNSVRESAVYALRYDDSKRVWSERLDLVNQAKGATQILNEVLGVSSTMPLWAERELDGIVSRFASMPISESSFDLLRSQLAKIGLADYFPQTLGKILDSKAP